MAPPSSGMNYLKHQQASPQRPMPHAPMPHAPMPQFRYEAPPMRKYDFEDDEEEEDYLPMIREAFTTPPPATEITCRQVADHVANCPVCGRLYHHDKMHTLYIILIVFLSIACLLLLKRNLNV